MTDAGSDPPDDRSDRDDGDDGRSTTDGQEPDEREPGERTQPYEEITLGDRETPAEDDEITTEDEAITNEDGEMSDRTSSDSPDYDGTTSVQANRDQTNRDLANHDQTYRDLANRDGDDRDDRTALDGESEPVTISSDGVLRWFRRSEDTVVTWTRDIVVSVGIVALIALILFGMSGVWPPLVAVESGSMEPGMQRGDMIFVVEQDRFVSDGAIGDTGVLTYENGSQDGHSAFGNPGDVIIFRPDGSEAATPVIHRAHYWVEEGENWVDERADDRLTNGNSCDSVEACPAPHDGFITHGDANGAYDQIGQTDGADTTVVKPEWIEGKAHYRIPMLGYIRLTLDEVFATPDAGSIIDGEVSIIDESVPITGDGSSFIDSGASVAEAVRSIAVDIAPIADSTGPITAGIGPMSAGTGQVTVDGGPLAIGSGVIATGGDAAERTVASIRDLFT